MFWKLYGFIVFYCGSSSYRLLPGREGSHARPDEISVTRINGRFHFEGRNFADKNKIASLFRNTGAKRLFAILQYAVLLAISTILQNCIFYNIHDHTLLMGTLILGISCNFCAYTFITLNQKVTKRIQYRVIVFYILEIGRKLIEK